MYILEVTEGPRKGERIKLKEGTKVVVGRQATAAFSVPKDGTLSGTHMTLSVAGGLLSVTDEGSSNGTYVDGIRIQAQAARPGQRIRAGHSEFLVSFLPSFGSWTIPAIPPGWAEVPGRGIQMAQPGRFPTNILFTEEEEPLEFPLAEYIRRQQLIAREALPKVEFSVPAPVRVDGADEASALRAQFAAAGGITAKQRQLYVVIKGIVGIISMTTIEPELPHVDRMFDAVAAKAQFEPDPPTAE